MAVSTIKKNYKVTDTDTIDVGGLSWTQGGSGMWYAAYLDFTSTGKIVSLNITSWSGYSMIILPYISLGTYIGFMATSKPPITASCKLRILEEL